MATEIIRTNSENKDFIDLVKDLDLYLALKDGEEHVFYSQFNKISNLSNCVVLYKNGTPVGCGAIKPYEESTAEVKRMYVKPEYRMNGYGSKILQELERWAKEIGFQKTILETGRGQTEAVKMYSKTYQEIPNFGQYKTIENSICFEKIL